MSFHEVREHVRRKDCRQLGNDSFSMGPTEKLLPVLLCMGHKDINWGYKRQMTSLSTIIPVRDKKGPEMQMTVLGLHFKLQSIIRL